MIGLLIKDLCLLKGQKKFFIVVIIMALLIAFSMQDVTFMVGYLSLIIPMFSLSTISYDEFDNGYPFLFTLPISRGEYVIEKYLFTLFTGIVSAVLSLVLAGIAGSMMGNIPIKKLLISVPVILGILLVIHSVLLPINIKFGGEKSRTVIILLVGAIVLIAFLITKILEFCKVNVEGLIEKIVSMPIPALVGIYVAVLAIIVFVSIKISIAIIKKKQF